MNDPSPQEMGLIGAFRYGLGLTHLNYIEHLP